MSIPKSNFGIKVMNDIMKENKSKVGFVMTEESLREVIEKSAKSGVKRLIEEKKIRVR